MHNNACKKRLLDALRATPAGRVRVEHAEKRVNNSIAKRLERERPLSDDRRAPAPGIDAELPRDDADLEAVPNDRDARLDHSVGEGAQFQHEDAGAPRNSKQENDDKQMHDIFMGTLSEEELMQQDRQRLAAEVNGITCEVMHLALSMGVTPQQYGVQLRA